MIPHVFPNIFQWISLELSGNLPLETPALFASAAITRRPFYHMHTHRWGHGCVHSQISPPPKKLCLHAFGTLTGGLLDSANLAGTVPALLHLLPALVNLLLEAVLKAQGKCHRDTSKLTLDGTHMCVQDLAVMPGVESGWR